LFEHFGGPRNGGRDFDDFNRFHEVGAFPWKSMGSCLEIEKVRENERKKTISKSRVRAAER
jgi:hypothetical protein